MNRRLVGWLLAALAFVSSAGCASPAQPAAQVAPRSLVVFAAASLTEAFEELAADFEVAHPGVRVVYNFAGSQQLAQQLEQGAPADVFASANGRQMQAAIDAGRVISATQQVFAANWLVVVVPSSNPAGLVGLQGLANPGLKLVLAAQEVPVGGYSLDFLRQASAAPGFTAAYSPTVIANVVSYEENVKAVLSKVALGEADAGIVYTSDAPPGAAGLARIEIPDALNVVARYPIAPIVDAAQPELARQFVDHVLSAQGQAILAKHGFREP
jgi:molybdate transport system substrate-binding protein